MKKDTKSLLWGLLAGGVAGSVTALLLAPKPGKELRKDIADGTTGAIDKVQEIAVQASDKSAELYGKAKDAVGSVVTEIKEWRKQAQEEEAALETVSVSGIITDEAGQADDAAEGTDAALAADNAALK
ncbi:YtxH domain-containing protein [Paenibacillus tepidiphilus]|uniref:YtxH domain-containing protein n=1 Tax=Paenibacillus tepidiphilus TaxID=2608683 RepID=UPI001239FEDB|nr:YtxH domain-containing protein [Paenibacillus tepidiphilus]